ncbi:NAD(P)-binding domain-containing protein [Micromonospora sp. DH14]|uniref:NADPH-dependent F420 reductase n=1 Tax=Micromonospora sp. DH14 TaxID=3040120 RepID=UPI002440F776|nr:NAD(P)-binding domain-containing protein [Micromonospora sp. DH14]MDG9675899.1 NAD(P)-binding domain-containing protein [Micromonospora sp. DH14]
MTAIAILGSGNVARALADKLKDSGHKIIIGSRDPRGSAVSEWARVRDVNVSVTDVSDAAQSGDVVINGLPGAVSLNVLRGLGPALSGKVLVDIANAVEQGPDGFAKSLLYPTSSLAEQIQYTLPQTKVVKTLNTVGPAPLMANPTSLPMPLSAFLSGNDPEAKDVVADLLFDLGWPREWIIDLGDVVTARWPESFVLMVRHLVTALGPVPFGLAIAR